jgi:RNA polymerase sigma-70 factor, ECF subfamily
MHGHNRPAGPALRFLPNRHSLACPAGRRMGGLWDNPRSSMVTLRSGRATARTRDLPTPHQQRTLAERIRAGERSAEDELVHVFQDRIAFLVRMRTHDSGAAPDLTQEVMLAVVLALRDGQLREADRLAAFVYGTARNVINNYLRTRSRLPKEDLIHDQHHPVAPSDSLENAERSAVVRRALTSLDSTDRKILLLTLVNGLKPGEIATRIGLTSDVVRARKSRALKKMIERVKRLSRR